MFFLVEESSLNKRIDIVLSEKLNITRGLSQRLIETTKVLVNGAAVKASYKLKLNDKIDVFELENEERKIIAKEIPINIVYEDDDVIIIDKDKDMVVHPGNGNYEETLVNSLMFSHKESLSGINGVIRPGIVHRIDKNTTGIIVVAKNDNAHKSLSEQFKAHSINRKYVALVEGIIEKDKLKINLPIGRDEKNRIKMAVTTKNSKNAVTNITVLKRYIKSNYTLVEAALETGRTHQIRVHMSYIEHPLVGDDTYGKKTNEFEVVGQLLHAKLLGFKHPSSDKYVEFSSEIHEDFKKVLECLDKKEEQQ
ncbi:MAG: RluA family pseudouridine synthase [Clostridia bacterium]|nr:RluA family pseudouridine synthase [Clostridia bacterium]